MNQASHPQPSKKGMFIAFIIVIAVILIVFGGIWLITQLYESKAQKIKSNYQPKPTAISATTVKQQTWNPFIEATGNAVPIQRTNISAQTSGMVKAIHFKSGERVEKGEKLFTLDKRTLEAQLKTQLASKKLAEITYKRYKELFKSESVSAQRKDKAKADYEKAKAQVQRIKSEIQHTEIKAPFSGKVGIRQIDVGNYFRRGDVATTLTTISPIYVDFNISGNQINKINIGQKIQAFSEAYENTTFKGKVVATGSEIDSKTRAIQVRAKLTNQAKKIKPGMFLNVHLMLPPEKNITTVPQSAINYTLYGDSVYVLHPIKNDKGKIKKASYNSPQNPTKKIQTDQKLYKAKLNQVKIGRLQGKKASITKGIQSGVKVVTSGQIKLKDGDKVIINNQYTPSTN